MRLKAFPLRTDLGPPYSRFSLTPSPPYLFGSWTPYGDVGRDGGIYSLAYRVGQFELNISIFELDDTYRWWQGTRRWYTDQPIWSRSLYGFEGPRRQLENEIGRAHV